MLNKMERSKLIVTTRPMAILIRLHKSSSESLTLTDGIVKICIANSKLTNKSRLSSTNGNQPQRVVFFSLKTNRTKIGSVCFNAVLEQKSVRKSAWGSIKDSATVNSTLVVENVVDDLYEMGTFFKVSSHNKSSSRCKRFSSATKSCKSFFTSSICSFRASHLPSVSC